MPRPINALRRLSSALARTGARARETNWWEVLVEIAVVVLGILIAFELNEWDQRRQARGEEAAVMRHLIEEATSDSEAIRLIRDQHRQSANNFELLSAALADEAAAARYAGQGAAGCNLLRLPGVRYHSAGALEAGERAEVIEDDELRHLIRRANAERTFNDRQLDYFRLVFNGYTQLLEPHLRWRVVSGAEADCHVDMAGLRADPRLAALLPKAARDQQQFAAYRNRELTATRAVARRAQCLSQGTCESTE